MKCKKHCETDSVNKPCLTIIANLLYGGKHAVNKVVSRPNAVD